MQFDFNALSLYVHNVPYTNAFCIIGVHKSIGTKSHICTCYAVYILQLKVSAHYGNKNESAHTQHTHSYTHIYTRRQAGRHIHSLAQTTNTDAQNHTSLTVNCQRHTQQQIDTINAVYTTHKMLCSFRLLFIFHCYLFLVFELLKFQFDYHLSN